MDQRHRVTSATSADRARYLDPESRRWTQEDPIGFAGGVNVYAYVEGSPLEATDPSGLNKSLDYWTAVPQIRPSGASARLEALLGWGEANWTAFLVASAYKQYQSAFAAQSATAAAAGGERAEMWKGAKELSERDFGKLVKGVEGALENFGDRVTARLAHGEIGINTTWVEAQWTKETKSFGYTDRTFGATMLHEMALQDLPFAVVHETLHLDRTVSQDEYSVNRRTAGLLLRLPEFSFNIVGCVGRRHPLRENQCELLGR